MTDSLLRRGQFALAPVQRRDLEDATALCAADPVAAVVPAMHIETARRSGVIPTGLWAVRRRGVGSRQFAGVVWSGANLTVIADSEHDGDDLRAELAGALIERVRRPAALVGPADLTLDLWHRVERSWGPARQIRESQASMVLTRDPLQPAPPLAPEREPVRRATPEDYPALLPAAVHMFVGEVGYDPLEHGRAAYEERLMHLIRQGRSYIQYGHFEGRRQIVFKSEVGVVGGGVAQLQGVWTHPSVRGLGIAQAGLSDVVRLVRADHASRVSLYVNDFNAPALRVYEALGFEHVGTFATVMF